MIIFAFLFIIIVSIISNHAQSKVKEVCKLHVWEYDGTGLMRCLKCGQRPNGL